VLIDGTPGELLLSAITIFVRSPRPSHLCLIHSCLGLIAFGYVVPTFGAYRVLSPKTTLVMPTRRASQHLHPDEGLPQITDQILSHQPSTQVLPTIAKTSEQPTLDNATPTQHPANMSTSAGSSHIGGGDSSTQINAGAPH
jgi:hypothetical protein